jgi:nucleotide-binding universal stress UspA family protein
MGMGLFRLVDARRAKLHAASRVKGSVTGSRGRLPRRGLWRSTSFVAGATPDQRTYLVVIDDSAEARVALQFAARRAAKTNGAVEVLAIVEPQDFVQWGGVQAAIEEEQRLRIEASVAAAVGEIMDAAGIQPHIIVRSGEPVQVVRTLIGTRDDIDALVLGAAPSGNPGPLVSNLTGNDAGKLPCPVMLIPGSLSDERLEALS